MDYRQLIHNYFSQRPFKEPYFQYLQADNRPFLKKTVDRVCRQIDNPQGHLFLPPDRSLLFYAVPNQFRSSVYGEPCYSVPTCLTLQQEGFRKNWPLLRNQLPTGIYEIQKDFILHNEWQEYIQAGAFSPGIGLKMVLKRENAPSSKDLPPSINIRPARPEDHASIQEIISEYQGNYLFHSPFLTRSATTILFRKWVDFATEELGSKLYVMTEEKRVVGLLNCMEASSFSRQIGRKVGIIDFIILKTSCRGKRYGDHLLLYGIHNIFSDYDFIELQTSLQNLQAVNFYTRHQFRLLDRRVIIHFKIYPSRNSATYTGKITKS